MTTVAALADPSPARFRERFPDLRGRVHLASCSIGARSRALDAALVRMLDALAGGAAAWTQFDRESERCRDGFAALVGAEPEQIALLPNASIGAYQAASTLALGARDTIVTAAEEFPSIAHVWLAQRRRGARVRYVETPREHSADAVADAYEAALDERTALVSVPLVTYAHGTLLPVADVGARARARGARVFVDAYQAVGVLPVDVDELGCDLLVAGSQKYLLGLPGIAFLYVRDGARTELEPTLTGWFGRRDPLAFDARRLDFAPSARRFETGTPAVPAIYAANAGLGLLAGLDLHAVRRHVAALGELAAARLRDHGERLAAPPAQRRGAHLALVDADPAGLAAWLQARGIAVSPRGSLVRVAFHLYNTADDVDALCAALQAYRARTATGPPS